MKNYTILIALPIAALLHIVLIRPIGILPHYLMTDSIYILSTYISGLIPVIVFGAHAYILVQFKQHRYWSYSHLIISGLYLATFVLSQLLIGKTLGNSLIWFSNLKLAIMLVWMFQLFASSLLRNKTLRIWYFALIALALLTSILEHIPAMTVIIYIARYGVWFYLLQNILLIAFYLSLDKMEKATTIKRAGAIISK